VGPSKGVVGLVPQSVASRTLGVLRVLVWRRFLCAEFDKGVTAGAGTNAAEGAEGRERPPASSVAFLFCGSFPGFVVLIFLLTVRKTVCARLFLLLLGPSFLSWSESPPPFPDRANARQAFGLRAVMMSLVTTRSVRCWPTS
jgi:hypothetical protein